MRVRKKEIMITEAGSDSCYAAGFEDRGGCHEPRNVDGL